ncbi:MAG: diguanylate cyclase (GGDEF)-like protein/PAS domain S-box-containing protein [Planctomycetota bacterium]|jgi:diguanylate cyclase (GGDEF)-like protein/PAS domain S-box-containing protein
MYTVYPQPPDTFFDNEEPCESYVDRSRRDAEFYRCKLPGRPQRRSQLESMTEHQLKSSPLLGKIKHTPFATSADAWVVVLLVAIFLADLVLRFDNGDNRGVAVFYVLPGLLTVWLTQRRGPQMVAAASSLLMLLGMLIGRGYGATQRPLVEDLTGLSVGLFAIWIMSSLSHWRRTCEAEVEAHRDTIATTLSSIADAVITTDCDDRITFMNPSACNATGWSARRAEGINLYEVFRIETDQGQEASGLIPHGKPQQFVLISRHENRIDVEATSAMIRDSDPDYLGRKRGQVLVFRDVSERVRQHNAMEELAYRDQLTGLPNRTAFFERLDVELARARRDDSSVALLFLDLDGFKEVNDTHGHQAGDHLLKVVAQTMTGCLREVDTVARLAGDEFTVILPGVQDNESAMLVADKLLLAVASPIDIACKKVRVTPSIGIALYPSNALDRDDLMQRADQAMYQAKSNGGYQAQCFAEMPTSIEEVPRPQKVPQPRKKLRQDDLEETSFRWNGYV